MSVGPIPRAAMEDWCDRAGIDDLDERVQVKGAIRAMDEVYLAPRGKSDGNTVSTRPASIQLFDALFS